VGQSVTFTATVANPSGVLLPTGHVEFFVGTTDLGHGTVPVVMSGSAITSTFVLTLPVTAGMYNYRAVYVPDGRLSSSAGSLPLSVAPGSVARLAFMGHLEQMVGLNAMLPFWVVVRDGFGNLVSGVTVRLDLVPVGGSQPVKFRPGSVTMAPALSGVATFVGVAINTPGIYVLRASVGSVTVLSDPFSVPTT
jgi:hypothetical protein